MTLEATASPAHRFRPLDLDDRRRYQAWREAKLAGYPRTLDALTVPIDRLGSLTRREREAILSLCRRANMALYAARSWGPDEDSARRDLAAFGAAFGLIAVEDHRSAERDGIVRIERVEGGGRLGYIPYTDRAINWHTDGYYNFHGPSRCVKALTLHCVRSAEHGGENRLLDHEIAYLRLRDADPALVEALMRPDAMAIPESVEAGGRVRPLNVGPVFYVDPATARLGMRFTARKRSVLWRDDRATRVAAAQLEEILESDPLVVTARLAPGQGLLCNNVLHDRSGFVARAGPQGRLLYRIRYLERVAAADEWARSIGG